MKFTLLELWVINDSLIAYKYQSNCPKNTIKNIQKKLLLMRNSHENH